MSNTNRYIKTTELIESNIDNIIDEIVFLQHTQTAILRNDFYLVKDKDTQAIFENILCKNQPKISPNNHQKAFDIKHFGNQISIKSGTINNNYLKFSYSRTTEYPTLEDKLKYLSTFAHLILGIASEKIKNNNSNIIQQNKYYLYYFPANEINLQIMDWMETHNQYVGVDNDKDIVVEIKKKMSDQPWITLPTSLIRTIPLVETLVTSHKNRKYLVVDDLQNNERSYYDIYEQRKKLKAIKGLKKCSLSTMKAPMA